MRSYLSNRRTLYLVAVWALTLGGVAVLFLAPTDGQSAGFENLPGAVQHEYEAGVPQTDAQGRLLTGYAPAKSFLPIGLYHALTGKYNGYTYSLAPAQALGCTFVHLLEKCRPAAAIAEANRLGLQLVVHNPTPEELARFGTSDRILAWYLNEEPTTHFWANHTEETEFAEFQQHMAAVKAVDPVHPVLVLDAPTFAGEMREWWMRWNNAGDISSHDNYLIYAHESYKIPGGWHSLNTKRGIPSSVSLAVEATGGHKPLWFVVQAHSTDGRKGPLVVFPTAEQERCMVYTAFICGATGIWYYCFDSYYTRLAGNFGISPTPQADYGGQSPDRQIVGPDGIAASQALWAAVTGINQELTQLKPVLLSPTSNMNYSVGIKGEHFSPVPIRCLLKQVGHDYYLLAANTDDTPLEVRFEFPRLLNHAEVMFDSAAAPHAETQTLTDSFPAWGVRVYKLTFA